MNRLALFDCDGTLVDSQHSICAAMEAAFGAHGLDQPCRAATRAIVGLSLVEAMAAMVPDGDRALHLALAESYKTAFQDLRAQGQVQEPLFDGIPALLDAMEGDGWLLGIVTGKSDRGLRLCLEAHGLHGRFATLQTADRHPSKPHPSMVDHALAEVGAEADSCLLIGDTSYDMVMAAAAGVRAIGVGWGYHEPGVLQAAGASHIVEVPDDLLALCRTYV